MAYIEALTKTMAKHGYKTLQEGLYAMRVDPNAPAPTSSRLVKKKRRARAPVSKAEFTHSVNSGMKGKHIAQKYGRTLSWVNKMKREYNLAKKR